MDKGRTVNAGIAGGAGGDGRFSGAKEGVMRLQPKKKETRLYVRLAAEEKEQLQLLANTHKSTLSEAARDAIREYLDRYSTPLERDAR